MNQVPNKIKCKCESVMKKISTSEIYTQKNKLFTIKEYFEDGRAPLISPNLSIVDVVRYFNRLQPTQVKDLIMKLTNEIRSLNN